MQALSPAMPKIRSDATRSENLRSSLLTTALFLALGFGSIAAALIEASGAPVDEAPDAAPSTAVIDRTESAAVIADDPEATRSVRPWNWETRGTAGPAAAQEEVQEL